jgi:hypothetical protein
MHVGSRARNDGIEDGWVRFGGPSGESSAYFEGMGRLQQAVTERNYPAAARAALENLPALKTWLREELREDPDWFVPPSIPALQVGGTMLALQGDEAGLDEMERLVSRVPALRDRLPSIEAHREDLRLVRAILQAVAEDPGVLQTSLKSLVAADDGRAIGRLVGWLEKGGRIVRVRSGKTYTLSIADAANPTKQPPRHAISDAASHRDGQAVRIRDLDLSAVPIVRLPRAPLRWEAEQLPAPPVPEAAFGVADGEGWRITSITSIPKNERPDPAFRRLYPMDRGLLYVDDLGKTEEFPGARSAGLVFDGQGREVARSAFELDFYRISVNPRGRGLIGLSHDGVVHAYDERLRTVLHTGIVNFPEMASVRKRLEIGDEELRNHVRTVALAPEMDRYLISVVDEAWCVGVDGRGLWGVRMPKKEGWTRYEEDPAATSSEVAAALELMGLSLPVSAADVKSRYRPLAKEWHPDTNGGTSEATQRFQQLGAAMSALTGLDLASQAREAGVRFVQERVVERFTVEGAREFTVSMGMVVGESFASDWVYASDFGSAGRVYIGGYSGRIVELDAAGAPVRVYDIGSPPQYVVDAGEYLYILAATRLYVLHDDVLHALVDTSDGGSLVVGQTGFGLLEAKRFRWFSRNGTHVGTVLSRDPIRRVFSTPDGLVVESRPKRAVVQGAPGWWE